MEMPGALDNEDFFYYAHAALPSNAALRNYSFCLDKTRYCALWVAYPLHACYLGEADRTDKFGYDPDVPTAWQANIGSNAYYPQGGASYSHARGHQLPSADRTATEADNVTTFYATNMTPQLQTLNGGQWQSLEGKVRDWICSDTLYVVTGAWFDPNRTPHYAYDSKGQGKACPVPTHYWKVLLRSKSGNTGKPLRELPASELQSIGFWMDHDDKNSWNVASSACSVREIERHTGFTFFVNVPDAPKSTWDGTLWKGL